MRALAAARRNPVALTNLGAFFGMEVTAGGLSISTSPPRISQAQEGRPKAICQYDTTYPRRIASLSAVRSNPQG